MKHLQRILLGIVVSMVVVRLPAFGSGKSDAATWHKLKESGITIEYQDDMAELARQVIPEAAMRFDERETPPNTAELRALVKHKDEVLQFIAGQLGLNRPTKDMVKMFDQLPSTVRVLQSIRDCRSFKIWHASELKKMVLSGYKDPWLTYRPETDTFNFGKALLDWKSEPNVRTVPIIIDDGSSDSPLDQVRAQLNLCQNVPKALPAAGVICHELAEMTMVYDLGIQCAFRRWFCDGAANCIAASCLRYILGQSAADKFLSSQDTEQFKDLRDQVDLLRWRAVEWEKSTPVHMSDRLSQAHYAYATYEVMGLVERNGPETIPAIFRELIKEKEPDEESILTAIKHVTGENFRRSLLQYGSKSTDTLKGLAVSELVVGLGEKALDDRWRMTGETTSIPLARDDSHGMLVNFRCAAIDPPVQMKIEYAAPRKPDGRTGVETCTYGSKERIAPIWSSFCFAEDRYMPGDASVKVYINDELVREVAIKLVDDQSASPAVGPVGIPKKPH